jgi:cell division protein FtsL
MSDQAISTARAPQRAPTRTAPTRTELRLVQEAKKRSRARQLVCAFALVIIFTALLASAVFHSVLVGGQQRLDRLDQRVEQRQQVLSRAELRVAQLSSPPRIVAAAKQRGMVLPAHTTWLAATLPATVAPAPSAGGKQTPVPFGELAAGGGGAAPAGQRTGSGRVR